MSRSCLHVWFGCVERPSKMQVDVCLVMYAIYFMVLTKSVKSLQKSFQLDPLSSLLLIGFLLCYLPGTILHLRSRKSSLSRHGLALPLRTFFRFTVVMSCTKYECFLASTSVLLFRPKILNSLRNYLLAVSGTFDDCQVRIE